MYAIGEQAVDLSIKQLQPYSSTAVQHRALDVTCAAVLRQGPGESTCTAAVSCKAP